MDRATYDTTLRGPRPGKSPPSSGFSLIEVVIAGFSLTLTVLGLTAALSYSHTLTEASREEIVARQAMREVLGRIGETPFDRVASDFHATGFAVPGLRPQAGDSDGMPGEVVFSDGPFSLTGTYEVTVRVRWRGACGARAVEGAHFLANTRNDPGVPPSIPVVEASRVAQ
ncbi:MAG: type IV pilus modification PilV family protein [Planctomycetota bacterium]